MRYVVLSLIQLDCAHGNTETYTPASVLDLSGRHIASSDVHSSLSTSGDGELVTFQPSRGKPYEGLINFKYV